MIIKNTLIQNAIDSKYKLIVIGNHYIFFSDDLKKFYISYEHRSSILSRINLFKTEYLSTFKSTPKKYQPLILKEVLGFPEIMYDMDDFDIDEVLASIVFDSHLVSTNIDILPTVKDMSKYVDNLLVSNLLVKNGIYINSFESFINNYFDELAITIIDENLNTKYKRLFEEPEFIYYYFYPHVYPLSVDEYKMIILAINDFYHSRYKFGINEKQGNSLTHNIDVMLTNFTRFLLYDVLQSSKFSIYLNYYPSYSHLCNKSFNGYSLKKYGVLFDMRFKETYYSRNNDDLALKNDLTSYYLYKEDFNRIKGVYNCVKKIFTVNNYPFIASVFLKMMGLPYVSLKYAKYFDFKNGTADEFIKSFNLYVSNSSLDTTIPSISSNGADISLSNTIIDCRNFISNGFYFSSYDEILMYYDCDFYFLFNYKKLNSNLKKLVNGDYKSYHGSIFLDNEIEQFLNESDAPNLVSNILNAHFQSNDLFIKNHLVGSTNVKIKEFFEYLNEGFSSKQSFYKLNIKNEITYEVFIQIIFKQFEPFIIRKGAINQDDFNYEPIIKFDNGYSLKVNFDDTIDVYSNDKKSFTLTASSLLENDNPILSSLYKNYPDFKNSFTSIIDSSYLNSSSDLIKQNFSLFKDIISVKFSYVNTTKAKDKDFIKSLQKKNNDKNLYPPYCFSYLQRKKLKDALSKIKIDAYHGRIFTAYKNKTGSFFLASSDKPLLFKAIDLIINKFSSYPLNFNTFFYLLGLPFEMYPSLNEKFTSLDQLKSLFTFKKVDSDISKKVETIFYNYDLNDTKSIYNTGLVQHHLLEKGVFILSENDNSIFNLLHTEYLLDLQDEDILKEIYTHLLGIDFDMEDIRQYLCNNNPTIISFSRKFFSYCKNIDFAFVKSLQLLIHASCDKFPNLVIDVLKSLINHTDIKIIKKIILDASRDIHVNLQKEIMSNDFPSFFIIFSLSILSDYIVTAAQNKIAY